MVERIPENHHVAALNRLEAVDKFVDEDAFLVREQRRHAGAFDFYGLVEEDDDDERETDGDEQVARPDANLFAEVVCGRSCSWSGSRRRARGSERGNDRRLCAKNQLPKRGFVETTLPGTLELTIRPTALRADGQAYRCRILPFEDAPKGRRLETFGENNLQAFAMRREGCLRFRNRAQRGRAQAAGLLGCFEENFLPPLGAFRRGCKKSLFAATRCERHYGADAQLGGFFEGELEGVESNDRK